ncbi:efflux transporter outer membrane subunit [Vreelandella utahensis]|uniref:efflux transporter outer membrane subunit n=1 Tax=Vreelandella halophila TaxID=86177 RepID=UPI0015C3DA84|nr:efflux transporter outer membrane subunit [Halomonas utahensis]
MPERLMVLLLAGLIAGCASQPEQEPEPPVTVPETFSTSGDEPAPERWWRSFKDDSLNQLVEDGLNANLDVLSAWQRLREARAAVDQQSADLYPDLNATADGEVSNSDGSDAEESLRLGLSSEYEVDLWGRINSQVEAEQFRTRATRADYQTAALSLSAEVTRTWYQLRAQRAQLDLAESQIETNRNVMKLLETQFGSGQAGSADVLRQRQLLESTEEQRLGTESELRVLENQLAVLLGRAPRNTELPDGRGLPSELPPLPDTGVPAELVQRRPDVRQAYNQLQAADADLAAAISNQFPRLTLSASASTQENSVQDLFDNWATTLAANLVAPLIDAGQRDAQVSQARAVRRQRLYDYGQTVLTAFQEVEDALVRERKQRQAIERIERQRELAEATYEQLRQQYFNGQVGYIDVLTALTDRQDLERSLISARRQLLEYRIALYRALAGGFDPRNDSASETG